METCASRSIATAPPPAGEWAGSGRWAGRWVGSARASLVGGLAAGLSGGIHGAALAVGGSAAIGARAAADGVGVRVWPDAAVGVLLAAVAGVAAHRLARTGRGAAAAGLAAAVAVFVGAVQALCGGDPAGAPVLLPFAAASGIGAAIAAPSADRSRRQRLLAVFAAGLAATAAAAWWPDIAAWAGHRAALAVGALPLLLACIVARPVVALPQARRPLWVARLVAGGAGVLLWSAAPAALWVAGTGLPVAGFLGCAALVVAAIGAGLPKVALLAAALASGIGVLPTAAGPGESATGRVLGTGGADLAVYARGTQELQLWSAGVLVDGEGPDRPQSELTATVLGALLAPGDRVLLLGLGAGRLPERLDRVGPFVVDAVDYRVDSRPLLQHLAGAGPVARPAVAKTPTARAVGGPRAALATLPATARQAVVVGEPLHARSLWQVDVEAQRELRRVAGRGLVVQPFAMDRTPPSRLRALLGAAAAAHPWNGVVAVGECALLVSAVEVPAWPVGDQFGGFDRAARWQAHAAHLGSPDDLRRAWLGTLSVRVAAEALADATPLAAVAADPGDRGALLDVLRASLEPPPVVARADDSVLLRWTAAESEWRVLQRRLDQLDRAAAAEVRAAAVRALPCGAPKAFLQAALGLPDENGARLRSPAAASLLAQAIDPTLLGPGRPQLFADLPAPLDPTGALEDLAALPAPSRLAELCSGEAPFAVALRARFPSACASALVEALAVGPLPPAGQLALRELADPFVLAEAGAAVVARGGARELLALWRGGLPMPSALRELATGAPEDRRLLVAALAGRRDAGSVQVLADGLADPDLALRKVAAAALLATVGDRVAYDPEWERSRLLAAAERLRALHNRAP